MFSRGYVVRIELDPMPESVSNLPSECITMDGDILPVVYDRPNELDGAVLRISNITTSLDGTPPEFASSVVRPSTRY